MRTIENTLSSEESSSRDVFFSRLDDEGKCHVQLVVRAIAQHARSYFSSEQPDICWSHFKGGEVFFALYGIGGNLTKEGDRPDIDLLLATNMRYNESPPVGDEHDPARNHDILTKLIADYTSKNLRMDIRGNLPDNYNLGSTNGKCLFELHPRETGKKIDLVYVRSMRNHGTSGDSMEDVGEETRLKHFFQSEEEFCYCHDVDGQQQPLPRAVLWRSKTTDFAKPERLLRP